MQNYRFLQDFKVGIGAPIGSGGAGGFIYSNYQTIFKKGDVAEGRTLTMAEQGYDAAPNPFFEPAYNLNIRFVKNGNNYDVLATYVTPVSAADVKAEAEKQKQWIFIIAAIVVAYFIFKK